MMDPPEGTSAFLQQLESKKNSVLNAMLMVALESKALDEQLDLTKESFEKYDADLDLERKDLERNRNSIAESRELAAVGESLESRLKEIECREMEFQTFQNTQLEEIMIKEAKLAEMQIWVVGKLQEVELKEETLIEQKKSMEALLQKFDVEKQEFEDIKKSVRENLNEISLREMNIKDQSKELITVQDRIETRAKELRLKEENVELREHQIAVTEKLNEERCKELDNIAQELDFTKKLFLERSEKLDSKERQLNSVQQYIRTSFYDFHAKSKQLKIVQDLLEKQLDDQCNLFEQKSKELEQQLDVFESKKKPLQEQCKQLEAKEKQFTELLKGFALKEKLFEEMSTDFDSTEKQLEKQPKERVFKETQINNVVNYHVEIRQVKEELALDLPAGFVSMDGRSLQLYLNEHFENHESLSGAVSQIFLVSHNPGMLVLDALEGFYPPHLKKGEVEFATNVVRRSCIFLLEQLMIITPQICPDLRKRALTLADEWKVKMKVLSRNPMEVYAFLMLLATYKLRSNFEADEILQLLWFIPSYEIVPELCRSLGLLNEVPDFIRRLIERRLYLKAIEYVCTFDLANEFPPATLLEEYIRYEEEATGKILEEGHYSIKAREIACRKELDALSAVMNCIKLHKLERQFLVGKIKERIEQLERRRLFLTASALYPSLEETFDSQTEERSLKKHKCLSLEHAQHFPSVYHI